MANNNRVHLLTTVFEDLGAVFIDTPTGEIKAQAVAGKDSQTLAKLMNTFFSWIVLYDLTRQWIMVDGNFDYDLTWLTVGYTAEEQERWCSNIFQDVFGIPPSSLIVL